MGKTFAIVSIPNVLFFCAYSCLCFKKEKVAHNGVKIGVETVFTQKLLVNFTNTKKYGK